MPFLSYNSEKLDVYVFILLKVLSSIFDVVALPVCSGHRLGGVCVRFELLVLRMLSFDLPHPSCKALSL